MRAGAASVGFKLASARGHLDGVIRMVDEDRYCIDTLHWLTAVQGALDRDRRDTVEAHLRGCVPEAISEGRLDDIVDELPAATLGAAPREKQGTHQCHVVPDSQMTRI